VQSPPHQRFSGKTGCRETEGGSTGLSRRRILP
jgi:hypothetical protein